MSDSNITRESARLRSAVLRTHSYQVQFDLSGRGLNREPLDAPQTHFVSTSAVQFSSEGGSSQIDIIADQVLSASLDGKPVDLANFTGSTLKFEAAAGEHTLTVAALCRYSNSGEGLHRFVDPADGRVYLYSQFESADARRAYACFDQPDQKATFQFSVIAPQGWTVMTNSAAVEPTQLDDGLAQWDFEPTKVIATYITAVIAGEYHVVPGTIRSLAGELPASIACRHSVAEHLDADRIFDTTQKGFEVFEKHFGHPYPFGSYDQVFVPEFNFGAMENAGCVTFRDEYLFRSRVTSSEYETRDNTILHELAHMWFGDLVTMRWWDDLWLNESFAEWASHFCQAQLRLADPSRVDPWVSFANERKTWAYLQDQLPTTHPIAADMVDLEAVEQNFDGITYAKGASVLKLLVSFVGEENFLSGVRSYFTEFAFGNTELSDLLGHLEKASGRDLGWFTGQWLETCGVNTFSADFDVDDQGLFTRFDIVQTHAPQWPTLRTHKLGIGIYADIDGALTRTERLDIDVAGQRTPVDALVGRSRGDLVLLNDGDLTYAKTRLDSGSLTAAINQLNTLTDPLARAMIWATAWDMTRDAEMSSLDYIRLVVSAVASEQDATAVSTVLRQALLASTGFTAPALRDEIQAELVTGLAKLLKEAQAGSDSQLSYATSLVSAVFTSTGTELIRGWLDGEEVPEGLVIDADLSWEILTALARAGVIGPERIAEAAEKDNTNAGSEKAAGALAALADPAAKEAAWLRAVGDPDVPNETHRQICGNFFQFRQEKLASSFADRYLETLTQMSNKDGVWASRGTSAREAVLRFLVPAPIADESFVARLQQWLDAEPRNEQVARGVRERIDGFRRALRCQERSLA